MSARELAQALVGALAGAGVRDVVACPGSRNAPLLLALAPADRRGDLRLHVRVDERGAAYLALGLAKATGRPGVVVTTSGTAVGNLLPAAMEARHSGVGLLLVAADRPASMRGTGASQTTWQPGLLAPAVERLVELSDAAPHAWADGLSRALGAAITGAPVHLNLELDAPLVEPADAYLAAPRPLAVPRGEAEPEPEPVDLPAEPGTVVLLGDAPLGVGRAAAAQALAAGIPVLAEPTSNGRVPGALSTPDLLLRTRLAAEVRRVVVVGRPTLSRPQRALLSSPDVPVVQVSPEAVTDRYPGTTLAVPAVRLAAAPEDGWLARWQRADAALRPVVDALAARAPLNGWGLTQAVLAHAPGPVFWGSSQLVRDADVAPLAARPAAAYALRGLAGIDGTVSAAAGVALGSEQPVTAVLGDLTALHDVSALALPALERVPRLRLVVGNDDGGAIFATLEQGGLEQRTFERVFGVPHGRSLADIARGFGLPASRVTTATELADAMRRPVTGVDVVEVALSRGERREQVQRLRDAAAALDVG